MVGVWNKAIIAAAMLLALLLQSRAAAYVTLANNGPSSNRVDIVFVGDGYRQADIDSGIYAAHIQTMLDHMFSPSSLDGYFFGRYESFFNIFRVDVVSVDNGADKGNYGTTRNTALDATYYYDGTTERLLYLSTSKANTAVTTALQGSGIVADMKIATVNDTKYGGGGQVSSNAWAVYAGGSSSSAEIALHELGHSFAGLADTYAYNTAPYTGTYTGPEPASTNATKNATGLKWSRWDGYTDPQTNIEIDVYEGAVYYQHGAFRPSDRSKMDTLGLAFDAVSREAFIDAIYAKVRPLDSYFSNATPITDISSLWVDTVDPEVILVNWFINGILAGAGENPNLTGLTLAQGLHTVAAVAYDSLLDHDFTGDGLDWWRLDDSHLTQTIVWQLVIPEPATAILLGGFLFAAILRRRRCPA
ncbi:MAG: M64 family metallopeptidase [Phycisphaeraceae bacterium]